MNKPLVVIVSGIVAVSMCCCSTRSKAPSQDKTVANDSSAASTDDDWQMTYDFDPDSGAPGLFQDGQIVWLEIHGDGRASYNETDDGADSNFSSKHFTLSPSTTRAIRDRVTKAVGRLVWIPAPEFQHEPASLLHGRIDDQEFQMPVRKGQDAQIQAAFEPLLTKAARLEWTYDRFDPR